MKAVFLIILSLFYFSGLSQGNDINQLEEVHVYSYFSPSYQVGYSITILTDSILKSENSNLSQLLKKQISAYIKEQGSGMTASISMRGSGASHTAVYWNGIPINSSLNGQTDFNTVFTSHYNRISIRKGGGSVLLGSGAIGGAINLENELQYINKTKAFLFGSIGSYDSYSTAAFVNHSTKKAALQVGFNGLSSENNYPYSNTEIVNENGEIMNYSVLLNTGFKLNNKHNLYLKTLFNNSDRNTSGTLYTTNNANLDYTNQSILLGWVHKNTKSQGEFKTAYLKEDYKYTFNKNIPDIFSDNGSKKWYTNYGFYYNLNSKIILHTAANYEILKGEGTEIEESSRQKLSFLSSLHHTLSEKLQYNFNIRKEWSSVYKIPFVFSFDTKQQWYKNHATSFNFSTNYRIPTLNDLYWQPGGNPDLIPEKSWSSELGYEWNYKASKFCINAFKSHSTDMIQWKPETAMYWKPVNIQSVTISGLEFSFKNSIIMNHHKFTGHIHYSYTISKDDETQKQLIYVPNHMGGLLLSYTNEKWYVEFDEQYNGSVYTSTSNTKSIDDYWLSSISVKRNLFNKKLSVGMDINNIFDVDYQIIASRPMPKQNLTLLINYKF